MPRPDTASFNRFLSSLGLLALAAALAIPYFFYRSTDTLRIDQTELSTLTPLARQTIEARQSDVAQIQPYVLPFAAFLIVLGIGFLFWGGRRLHGAQEVDDREALAKLRQAEEGVRDLTRKEKEVKIEKEVADTTDETQGDAPKSPPPMREKAPSAEREPIADRVKATQRIEEKVLLSLGQTDFPGYIFRPQVAVGGLQLDGLFLSYDGSEKDVLLEVRVGTALPGSLVTRRLLDRKARYENERRRECRPWLVLVVPDSASDRTAMQIDRIHRRLKHQLDPLGWATVVRESEIWSLPAIFRGLKDGF